MLRLITLLLLVAALLPAANEITLLECRVTDGVEACLVLSLYAIATPIQVGGSNVVPTPSSGLSASAAAILSAGEKTALDEGTAAFEVGRFQNSEGLTGAPLLTELRRIYASRKAAYLAKYAARYARLGDRYDSE
jgi:hypothetical protein